jgi:phosphoadenosine phosphosulfate reductase
VETIVMSNLETSEQLVDEARRIAARGSTEELLGWIESRFGDQAAIASSFSIEDVVLIHLASVHAPSLRVIAFDTGRLPPETFETMEEVRQRYHLDIEIWLPDRALVEGLERDKGFFSFRESRQERIDCCAIRKHEPMSRALLGKAAWLSGLRRGQAPGRVETAEVDAAHGGIVRLNPLARWTEEDVWSFARAHAVPVHALHVRGYPSIDCAPCIRAVAPGEDERSGRFWWEATADGDGRVHQLGLVRR